MPMLPVMESLNEVTCRLHHSRPYSCKWEFAPRRDPTSQKRVSSPGTSFTHCLWTSFTFPAPIGEFRSSVRRSSNAGSRGRFPSPGWNSNTPTGVAPPAGYAPVPQPVFCRSAIFDLEYPPFPGGRPSMSMRLPVLPRFCMGIVAPRARSPRRRRSLHPQRLMGTHLVVFPAIAVQPRLGRLAAQPTFVERALQAAVEPLHLALRLGMTNPAPAQ